MPYQISRVPRPVFTRVPAKLALQSPGLLRTIYDVRAAQSLQRQRQQLAVQRQRQQRAARQLAVQRHQQQLAARRQQLAVAQRQAAPPTPEAVVASYVARQDTATAQQFTGLVQDIASANTVAVVHDVVAAIFDAFGDADDSPGSAIAKNNAFLIAAGAIPEATVPRTRTGVIRPHGTEIE